MASARALALAVSLTLVVQLTTSRIIPPRQARQAVQIPTALPNNWTYLGCYSDNVDGRALAFSGYNDDVDMTAESCIMHCVEARYPFAGIEGGADCYCGDKVGEAGKKFADAECTSSCPGDASQACGGADRLTVYNGPVTEPAPLAPIAGWAYEGCFSDRMAGRTLLNRVAVAGGPAATTNQLCTSACESAGYPLAGTEAGGECYCGEVYSNGGAQVEKGCNVVCSGDSEQICGGTERLSLWSLIGSGSNPTSTIAVGPVETGGSNSGGGGGGSGDAVAAVAATSAAERAVVALALPAAWAYRGCYAEPSSGRAFLNQQTDSATLTVDGCVATCVGLGYGVAGLEYGVQCFCDDVVRNGATAVAESDCNMACSGDATQDCGAGGRLSVYSDAPLVVHQPPRPQTEGLPDSWEYVGCILDDIAIRTFPWMGTNVENTTISTCLAGCSKYGYNAGGIEYGYQCFCGDVQDVVNTGRTQPRPESECNVACSGDATHICGGGNRISYYRWTGAPLTTWSWAQGIAAGRYDFIMSSPIIPLVSSVSINGKVVFVEKHGTSLENNSTGSFEFDPSLAPDYGTAFRELQLKTDVFCSASLVLPDKAGRQINIGGWSLDSLYGIRFFTPDSALGRPGSTQWEEDVDRLKMFDPRWYPTATVLSNGSILAISGENGSDGPMVPTAEVLPRPPGVTASTYLDYLANVAKVNSYPFVAVLPSGNMFFSQYNEARIISQRDFATVRMLPPMPGAVNNPDSGRNYPLQGTMSLMPQHAPYTDPLTVLICGGTTDGANFALDNCISTQPDVPGTDWTIERMQSTRVVSCMVGLPDGRFLIMNGAYAGRAGFGLAPNPNKGVILYDPSKPVGARMTQWANTTIARLYHSEAVLMDDGRVLVSGSDPEDGKNPQEHRLEYFSPDYVLSGAPRPTFELTERDWAYEQTVPFRLGTAAGAGAVRVSLLGSVGSTHGSNMGQRTLFPAVSCVGRDCVVTAPPDARVSPPSWYQFFVLNGPTPSHAVWVRVGGDPAGLGNWPDLPGFTPPGV